ncbi:plasmid replication initiator TrfA [Aromatoleum petrolei]|uniref:Uncharacterized protein n=1 Tax=Aromatoleum petrolei TaxID=76116 RepID=A0ABX1MG80_9RHOO|nr:plasmid replication initiator TrfA [Aromatoleum petrolei]NMF86944.1 hypothetical protein [Aromatoleum petrolei]QTQ37538.1 Plasmid replication initiator family protein [Aromatoleum petrolei]
MNRHYPTALGAHDLLELANRTATTFFNASPEFREAGMAAAEALSSIAAGMARRLKARDEKPAVCVLPDNATVSELQFVRTRQAARRGADVYLPSWASVARALPDAFLRSALFSASRSVQATNDAVLAGDRTLVVSGKEVITFNNITLMYSGYALCQFDRQVYATCLNYYRERPLSPEDGTHHVSTSFYEFARHMGSAYSVKAHKAIRASLLRLSLAQLRLRVKRMNIEVPKLLSVSFEDGEAGDLRGSDVLLLRITESVAELFGQGAWKAVDVDVADYDGLKGWIANFYASHDRARWLPVDTLYMMSGYESRKSNFRAGLLQALEKLKEERTPLCSRVADYHFSKDGTRLLVVRTEWRAAGKRYAQVEEGDG